MGLIDSIRRAEEKARHAYERAADLSEDTQRRIRQKMRIYPRLADTTPGGSGEQSQSLNPQEPIVSISGKDVAAEDLGNESAPELKPAQPTERRRRRNAA